MTTHASKTYAVRGTHRKESGGDVFVDVPAPGGNTVRMMSKRIYEKAIAKASDKARQLIAARQLERGVK